MWAVSAQTDIGSKNSKIDPRLDQSKVGTRQPALFPSSTNSLEPSPSLAPSESLASGRHGFAKGGHDAKITKIGVIPTGSPPSQAKPHDSGHISRCMTYNWV